MKSFRCADAGLVCDAEMTGESEEEVLATVVAHARDVHRVDLAQSTTLMRHARSVVRDGSGDPAQED